ncbi:uncharacterized protein HD556DRAFT_112744 [Suillus plorans]|uniref:Uncharacterized protein n=1 Tax=Suillus plorans TaxID=116603 RepID=A0A9P7DAH8_9AGAM|nr:uncharacterized protein HD556DRAFT_112744 [Suillus plorans]KAG1785504.1 hypothetical protein HD556DRAFT_112744 [Suillus plorans]
MESDFDVCAECGSLAECDHDRETLTPVPSRGGACSLPGVCKPDLALEIDTLDMCSVKPILPHSEVFNTYGSLSNAELISRYGFTLPENECDIVSLGYGSFSAFINNLIDDVVHSSADCGNDADMQGRLQIRVRYGNKRIDMVDERSCFNSRNLSLPTDFRVLGDEREIDDFTIRFLRIYSHFARHWTTEPRWDEMGDNVIVYNSPSISSPRPPPDDPDSALPEAFNINSEGKMTHTLWLFCVLFATCICSPGDMTNLAHLIFPDDNEPRQSFVEDVKRYLVDVQDHIDNARETGDDDEEVSVSTWSDPPSDTRDDSYFHVPQSHLTAETETDIGGISKDENNVLASAKDSACFISSLQPTSSSLGLDLPIEIRPDGDACVPAHTCTTKMPSAPSSASQAVVWNGLRRRSNVEEERPQKRMRHTSPHAVDSQEDLPFDIFGCGEATNAHQVAQTLALIVVHLCQHRVDPAHVSDVNAGNLTAAELGELLDGNPFLCVCVTPMHMHRTRVAMLLALNEKSILESCASTWGAVLKNIHDINKE